MAAVIISAIVAIVSIVYRDWIDGKIKQKLPFPFPIDLLIVSKPVAADVNGANVRWTLLSLSLSLFLSLFPYIEKCPVHYSQLTHVCRATKSTVQITGASVHDITNRCISHNEIPSCLCSFHPTFFLLSPCFSSLLLFFLLLLILSSLSFLPSFLPHCLGCTCNSHLIPCESGQEVLCSCYGWNSNRVSVPWMASHLTCFTLPVTHLILVHPFASNVYLPLFLLKLLSLLPVLCLCQ